MTSKKHWVFFALIPAISACAGTPDKQEEGIFAEKGILVETCDKVAITGSLIKRRVVCDERVDFESIAAYEHWRSAENDLVAQSMRD